jgi:hypothetical protein
LSNRSGLSSVGFSLRKLVLHKSKRSGLVRSMDQIPQPEAYAAKTKPGISNLKFQISD